MTEENINEDVEFGLIMPFKDQSHAFAHGFECGQIWQQLSDGKTFEHEQIHAENREQVEMMCKRFLYDYEIGIAVNDWCSFNAKPNPAKSN